MVRPNGDPSWKCCDNAVIWATDCSVYRLFILMPPWSAGPYTTALAVVWLNPIFGRNVIIA
jgi:hypothetical protein